MFVISLSRCCILVRQDCISVSKAKYFSSMDFASKTFTWDALVSELRLTMVLTSQPTPPRTTRIKNAQIPIRANFRPLPAPFSLSAVVSWSGLFTTWIDGDDDDCAAANAAWASIEPFWITNFLPGFAGVGSPLDNTSPVGETGSDIVLRDRLCVKIGPCLRTAGMAAR